MVKKRLIFTLLYRDGKFNLSRNFSLQAVGDLNWLKINYDFETIMYCIDELIILNVDRANSITKEYLNCVSQLVHECFIPVACGGGIKSVEDTQKLLNAGADKVVINTLLTENRNEVEEIIDVFGSQFVVGSIDYKSTKEGFFLFSHCGQINTGISLEEGIKMYQEIGIGELYLTSIQKDGTGQGYDFATLNNLGISINIPIIISGGAGKPEHLEEAFQIGAIDAVATANLFNFMSGGLKDARLYLLQNNINLARWKL